MTRDIIDINDFTILVEYATSESGVSIGCCVMKRLH